MGGGPAGCSVRGSGVVVGRINGILGPASVAWHLERFLLWVPAAWPEKWGPTSGPKLRSPNVKAHCIPRVEVALSCSVRVPVLTAGFISGLARYRGNNR